MSLSQLSERDTKNLYNESGRNISIDKLIEFKKCQLNWVILFIAWKFSISLYWSEKYVQRFIGLVRSKRLTTKHFQNQTLRAGLKIQGVICLFSFELFIQIEYVLLYTCCCYNSQSIFFFIFFICRLLIALWILWIRYGIILNPFQ